MAGVGDGMARELRPNYVIQEQFGRGSLSFRVDQMTLTPRKEIMERQKKLADCNMDREIDCFYNMINVIDDW